MNFANELGQELKIPLGVTHENLNDCANSEVDLEKELITMPYLPILNHKKEIVITKEEYKLLLEMQLGKLVRAEIRIMLDRIAKELGYLDYLQAYHKL